MLDSLVILRDARLRKMFVEMAGSLVAFSRSRLLALPALSTIDRPLVSHTYNPLLPQPSCFHNHADCRVPTPSPISEPFQWVTRNPMCGNTTFRAQNALEHLSQNQKTIANPHNVAARLRSNASQAARSRQGLNPGLFVPLS
jgi:hypothetical protein